MRLNDIKTRMTFGGVFVNPRYTEDSYHNFVSSFFFDTKTYLTYHHSPLEAPRQNFSIYAKSNTLIKVSSYFSGSAFHELKFLTKLGNFHFRTSNGDLSFDAPPAFHTDPFAPFQDSLWKKDPLDNEVELMAFFIRAAHTLPDIWLTKDEWLKLKQSMTKDSNHG